MISSRWLYAWALGSVAPVLTLLVTVGALERDWPGRGGSTGSRSPSTRVRSQPVAGVVLRRRRGRLHGLRCLFGAAAVVSG